MVIDVNRRQSMAIDKHKIFVHRLVIDFQYQSIYCYRLIDYQFHRLIRLGKFIRKYIRDRSCVFSISSRVRVSITPFRSKFTKADIESFYQEQGNADKEDKDNLYLTTVQNSSALKYLLNTK